MWNPFGRCIFSVEPVTVAPSAFSIRMPGRTLFHNSLNVFFMKTIVILLWVAAGFTGYNPEQRTITGTVTSENGLVLSGVNVAVKGNANGVVTDQRGQYRIVVTQTRATLIFSFDGFKTREISVGNKRIIDVVMIAEGKTADQPPVEYEVAEEAVGAFRKQRIAATGQNMTIGLPYGEPAGEEYRGYEENIFHGARNKPLSTFSIDVDVASYANVRRFIQYGQRPPVDAVRIEELINYFSYDYAEPSGGEVFAVHTEVAPAPWNEKHQLVHIGIQGKRLPLEKLPSANLVFLIDVSGSMNHPNKLPLVKQSFRMLVDQLRDDDHVGIVVYAGASRVVLEPTAGREKRKIFAALETLEAGGSTAGAAGLRMAYALAQQYFGEDKNNRVILATDGDFNVGESSDEAMEALITRKRKEGIDLTVLGYGMGNLKDAKMELLADKGNGNYAYIDNLTEARKVLVSEMAGTLFTIAKDVKIQVEFNPARVEAYRLVGYENRKLNDEDFNNDRKDAGDLGAGHTVTALYEVIPVGVKSSFYSIDDLKYQPEKNATASVGDSREWMTVKLRYKEPGSASSNLKEYAVTGSPRRLAGASDDFRWSAAVAAFGMLLKESPYVQDMDHSAIVALARGARGADYEGYRAEFINLVQTSMRAQ